MHLSLIVRGVYLSGQEVSGVVLAKAIEEAGQAVKGHFAVEGFLRMA